MKSYILQDFLGARVLAFFPGSKTMDLHIDPGFSQLICPLTADEYQQLEQNLLAEGCRDALVVWPVDGKAILLDGHNRYRICRQHNLPFTTLERHFGDREAAQEWIIRNQLGRRNLQPFQRVELALKLEPAIAAKAKENLRQSGEDFGRGKGCQNSDNPIKPIDTKKELAQLADVSHDTFHKAKVLAEKADMATSKTVDLGGRSESRRGTPLELDWGRPLFYPTI